MDYAEAVVGEPGRLGLEPAPATFDSAPCADGDGTCLALGRLVSEA
jgi:hypothetical protein